MYVCMYVCIYIYIHTHVYKLMLYDTNIYSMCMIVYVIQFNQINVIHFHAILCESTQSTYNSLRYLAMCMYTYNDYYNNDK